MSRLRHEDDGFTMVTSVVSMALVLLLAGIAVANGVASLASSTSERRAEQAQAAADTAADVAGYRMNKALLSSGVASLAGVDLSALALVGCTGASLTFGESPTISPRPQTGLDVSLVAGLSGQLRMVPAAQDFCMTSASEPLADGASFRYAVSTGLDVTAAIATSSGIPLSRLVVRKVAAIGTSGTVSRRVIATYWLDLADPGFKRRRYVRCPASFPAGNPFGGCPDDPPY